MYIFAWLDAVAKHRAVSIILVGLLSFGGSWLFARAHGIPVPQIQDEFSYILAGDTFAHSRVTNPTPPMWEHFETFHQLMQPTYMSKYTPAQGFFIGLAKMVKLHSIYGIWLSAALMCASICWMLYAWVPARWALIGGLVSVMQFGVFTYWSQSYWGGAVAAMAGALIFGALPRIFKYQRLRDAIWFGIGIFVMLNSRPLEGILIAIPVGCLVLPWVIDKKILTTRRFMTNAIIPTVILLSITLVGVFTYNKQITGDGFLFPHRLYAKNYTSVPVFTWEKIGAPLKFNNTFMEEFEEKWARAYFLSKQNFHGLIELVKEEGLRVFLFFFGYPIGLIALCIFFLLLWGRWGIFLRVLAAIVVIIIAIASTYCRVKAHYYAPITCLFILAIVNGLRGLSLASIGRRRLGLILLSILLFFQLGYDIVRTPIAPRVTSLGRIEKASQFGLPPRFSREQLLDFLLHIKGKHLVIIKYEKGYSALRDWVYNQADIENARVVWARSLGDQEDAKLIDYFKDRTVWVVELFWMQEFRYDARE